MFPIGDNIASTRFAVATWTLIAICTAVFLYQISLPEAGLNAFLRHYALVPKALTSPAWADRQDIPSPVLSLLTNTFLHGGILHIVLNLWTLYVFGPALEERLGSARFIALYLGSAIAASAAHALFNLNSEIPALGASGAIAGVIAAYSLAFPYAWIRVVVPIFIFPFFFSMPALAFAAFWFFLQVIQGTSSLFLPEAGGIAWWAHIGGFLAGIVLSKRLQRAAIPARPSAIAGGGLPFRWFA